MTAVWLHRKTDVNYDGTCDYGNSNIEYMDPSKYLERKQGVDNSLQYRGVEIHRLLAPERAVVIEGSDAFGGRDKIGRAFLRHLLDKLDDRLFGRSVVPRGQRIGGDGFRGEKDGGDGEEECFHVWLKVES
jgi:hypothetical protein